MSVNLDTRVSPHFTLRELVNPNDSHMLEMIGRHGVSSCVSPTLLKLLETLRGDKPLKVNSCMRSSEYQDSLRTRGFRAAEDSLHVVREGMVRGVTQIVRPCIAVDIDRDTPAECDKLAAQIDAMCGAKVRILTKMYRPATFVHVDLGPFLLPLFAGDMKAAGIAINPAHLRPVRG